MYFARSGCDYVILETGLGGAEDATNVISSPLVSVIASISMDHMNILGSTMEEIASCKAGIIKENCPAVVMKQMPSVQKVFEDRCRQMNSKFTVADYDMATVKSEDIKYRRFDYKEFDDIVISLTGKYQINNAVLALEVIKELRAMGIIIPDEAVYEGMVKADWPARFSCLDDGKIKFFADGAHNEDAARSLRETMQQYFSDKKLIFIMGMLADKEYGKVIGLTADMAEFIITITPPSPRALDAEQLRMAVSRVNRNVSAALSLAEAVDNAYEYAKSGDDAEDYVIVAFGSLSYMGDLYRVMDVRKAERS